jgi:hypothetical protein
MSDRVQAKRLPNVYRATISVVQNEALTYMPRIDEVKNCPEEFLPGEQWERDSLFQFSELRMVKIFCFLIDLCLIIFLI